ncbi:MAG: DUF11 domain-containing protein [Chloroflexi bacterium]|nr:DUF11 domain-containing protein [Chloroflexota bacterium]MCI0578122.1 DUF11 domain-containing protein [Chloroflexota bacterium]MCI0645188.1 DUF11 domain-containing protein [Chloroflexota bacterium]MCI0730881.1 DUF11 domain-containing protein [Chloroflexota bacterium]
MRKKVFLTTLLVIAVLAMVPLVALASSGAWFENFDSYATGSQMHGQGGWKGWDNNGVFGALTSSAQARSAPNSVDILGASDLVHEYEWPTSGQWTYTAWQYIPGNLTGVTYFIMLNIYNDGGPYNWSTQVNFDSVSDMVINDGISGGTAPIVYDQWVEIRVEIDLTADTQTFYYNGTQLYSGTWTGEVSGGGIAVIDAVDLFANNASSVYYDDISLIPAGFAGGIAIDKSPATQNVVTGGNANFTITVTNTGTVTLTNVTVGDAAVAACAQSIGSLGPGASQSYNCADVGVTNSYTNTAVVTGTIVGGPTFTGSDSAIVNVVPPTDVSLSSFGGGTSSNMVVWVVTAAAVGLGVTLVVLFSRRRRQA